jgi:alpha-tubulin suppressor-like RCC1 family protein
MNRVAMRAAARGTILAVFAALVAAGVPAPAGSASGTSAGQLYAFGWNVYGQLGSTVNNKTQEPEPTPSLVPLPGEVGPVVQVAAGYGHSLALTSSGQVYAFGENLTGELGNTTNDKTQEPNPTPTPVALPGQIGQAVQVAAGYKDSFVVTSSGQLFAFGLNNVGQLGNATSNKTQEPNPTPTPVALPGQIGPVVQVAAGDEHALVLTSSGQLYAFGSNSLGQLGNATNDKTPEPNPTPTLVTLPGAVGQVVQIAAGEAHSLVLTSGGQLYTFGDNIFGQLGRTASAEPNPTPIPVVLPDPVVQIAAGGEHSLALTSSGQLYAFGYNYYGELGDAFHNKTSEPTSTPQPVALPGEVGSIVRVAGGEFASFVLTASGQLYAFGDNFFGELGNATNIKTEEPNPTPTIVGVPGGATIDTMSIGNDPAHTLVVVADLAVASGVLPAAQVGVPYTGQAQGVGGALPYRWAAAGLPPGLSINSATGAVSGTPTTAGSYAATLTLTDSDGIEAAARLLLAVNAAPVSRPPLPTPTISAVHESTPVWREGRRLATISGILRPKRRPPVGTVFSFTLNEQAAVTFNFTQQTKGRRVGRRCAARTHANARRKSCKRTVARGTLSFSGHSAVDRVTFQGRLSPAKALAPGRYTLIITATNAAGHSAPASLGFTIVK